MPEVTRPRALVTGGAGFLGSHLCGRLLREGWDVVSVDSFLTGDAWNLAGYRDHPAFRLVHADVTQELPDDRPVHAVLHLASAASPVMYLRHPIETLRVGALGTERALELAAREEAVFLLASTSEVYGDPEVHPQSESYRGNVSPIGPRSVYDEAKRYAEALAMAYHRARGVSIRIARIFNTYGPRMRMDDGRAVPTFIQQGLRGEHITVHGDGSQTRSLCYVDDLIEGLWRLLNSDQSGPLNLGNPHEVTMVELAEAIRTLTGSSSEIVFRDRPEDDPERRCPDITLAGSTLGWKPEVTLEEGLSKTVGWAQTTWS
jgi:dTDP-glucose 4,6-dehydratase